MFTQTRWNLPRWAVALLALALAGVAQAQLQTQPQLQPAGSPAMRAASCLYEIQADAWRVTRLHRELATLPAEAQIAARLRAQALASTTALSRNLRDALPGLRSVGMEVPYHRLEDAIAGVLSEVALGSGASRVQALRDRDADLVRLADAAMSELLQKQPQPAPRAWVELGLIGAARTGVERLAHDFEFCTVACSEALAGQLAVVERHLDALDALPRYFPAQRRALAHDQWMFVRQAVRERTQRASPFDGAGDGASSRTYLIVATGHLQELLSATMATFVDRGGL